MSLCPCSNPTNAPCSYGCTCRYPFSSEGCKMCDKYGKEETTVVIPQDLVERIVEGLINRGEVDIAAMLKRYLPKPPKIKIYIYISQLTGDYVVREFPSNNPNLRPIEEREIDLPS